MFFCLFVNRLKRTDVSSFWSESLSAFLESLIYCLIVEFFYVVEFDLICGISTRNV